MGTTRGAIKYEIWLRLGKTPQTPGFYTDAKLTSVIQESCDYIGAEQILADEGYRHKLDYLNVPAGCVALAIPADVVQVIELRYLIGNEYFPLTYDQGFGEAVWADGSGVSQFPDRFAIIDNNFYFRPPIGVGGANYLQLEYFAYARRFKQDADQLPNEYDRCMFWFIIYNSCVLLDGQLSQQLNWAATAKMWYDKAMMVINMRTRQVVPIKNFEG